MIGAFFHTVFYLPLYNGLVFLIDTVPFHDVGIALILLTVLVKGALYPLSKKASLSQHHMRALEPHLSHIKEKHANDKAEQAKRTMELYKEHGINPFTSFLTILIQLPILIALYLIFLRGGLPVIKADFLYSFIQIPTLVNTHFLGLIDLSTKSIFLALLAGVTQFVQARLALPPMPHASGNKNGAPSLKDDFAKSMNVQFRYVMPVIIAVISYTLPSAIALYWSAGNIFAVGQELLVKRAAKKIVVKPL